MPLSKVRHLQVSQSATSSGCGCTGLLPVLSVFASFVFSLYVLFAMDTKCLKNKWREGKRGRVRLTCDQTPHICVQSEDDDVRGCHITSTFCFIFKKWTLLIKITIIWIILKISVRFYKKLLLLQMTSTSFENSTYAVSDTTYVHCPKQQPWMCLKTCLSCLLMLIWRLEDWTTSRKTCLYFFFFLILYCISMIYGLLAFLSVSFMFDKLRTPKGFVI